MPHMTSEKVSTRLVALDYLRGFFIVVIIIDHLARWPSLLALITGKALLWITAAEGFVIISGLLVGYVRGYKNKSLSMGQVSMKLISRGMLLYVWSIIATIAYTAIIWYVPLLGGAPGMMIEKDEWLELLANTFTLNYTYVWVYFLALYAIFLVASPVAIWLLRTSRAWLVIVLSLLLLVVGWQTHIEALQWQALFFIPSVAGYYLESIKSKWLSLSKQTRDILVNTAWGFTAITIIFSVLSTFYSSSFTHVASLFNDGFPASVGLNDLTIDRTGRFLYAATGAGVFSLRVREDAPTVSVSGRVTTPVGRSLRNAVVSITDSLGVRRTATTSSFGLFTFGDVATGATYVIGVSSKRFRFASRNVTVNGSLADVDFVGLE